LLGEGEGEVVSGRVEEKGKEDIWLGAGHCCQKRKEMRVGGGKLSPSSRCGGGGISESFTLASCKVFKGTINLFPSKNIFSDSRFTPYFFS